MRKRVWSIFLVLVLCLGLTWLCAGCGEADGGKALPTGSQGADDDANTEPPKYAVTFQSGESTLTDVVVEVEEGKSATPPNWTLPSKELTGWSQDTSNVKQDMTVTAQWEDIVKIMNGVEISQYAETRTVTVRVHDGAYDGDSSGSGFFIDDDGTLITNYHVIEYADSFEVQLGNAVYAVNKIVNFSEKYDLAILKADITGNDYFELTDEVLKGEQVYAVGSALGSLSDTMTSGIVSHTARETGVIECIQTDAAISHGNSGGPLINDRGQVVGVNSFSYTSGTDLNLAIKTTMLEKLGEDRNYSITDYIEWWKTEIARSYMPTNSENTNKYQYSLINTYHNYTNSPCLLSTNEINFSNAQYDCKNGYDDNYWVFVYDYNQANYDSYVTYLKGLGFVYMPEGSATVQDEGSMSTFYSNSSGFMVNLITTNERSDWGGQYLLVRTTY